MSIVLPFRYTFFGIFVICNAIICSAAAWNFGIAQMFGRRMDIDAYLIFLGALDLAFIVVVSVIELTRRNAVVSRVWFECSWLGLMFILHLCGAAVLTARGPQVMCSVALVAQISDACTSIRLTLAASWICVTSLLIYFFTLVAFACVCYREDRTVWRATVREYPWDGCCKEIPNAPPPPPKPASIKAPQPRRLALPALYAHRSRHSADYDIEPGQTFPPPHHMSQITREAIQPPPPSLYPRHLQAYAPRYQPPPPQPVAGRSTTETPPPLGSWPRANIINEPVHKKRRAAPAQRHLPEPAPTVQPVYVPLPTSRPLGPRTTPARPPKKPSGDWRSRVVVPPPLDLSKISSKRPSTR